MRQALRPYQLRAIEAVRQARRDGAKRVLLVAPTGAGKTTIASEIILGAMARGTRSLVVAHRRELIDQCSRRLDQWSVDHGVIQATHWRWRPTLSTQVGSVQTLVNRFADGKIKPDFRMVIIDEAHRSTAPTYGAVIDACAGSFVLGLTATPCRQNGKGLGELYDQIVMVAQPLELIADGFLMEPTIYAPSAPDLKGVKTRGGDYVEGELQAAMDKPKLVGSVVESWRSIVGLGKRSVVFATGVEHSQHIVAEFQAAGIRAAHLDGETPTVERDRVLAELRSGQIEVIANCGILTEGWDLPALDAAILARPTRSLALYLQMIGRVLRPHPGKERAIVLDHAGAVARHGWPTANREWSLELGASKESNVAPVKNCPKCGVVMLSTAGVCPSCGFVFEAKERKPPRHAEGTLEAIERPPEDVLRASASEMVEFLAEKVRFAIRKRMKLSESGWPGWASWQFKERYYRWPNGREKNEARRLAAIPSASAARQRFNERSSSDSEAERMSASGG